MNSNKAKATAAVLMLMACTTSAATTERPQLKNYSSYTDFLRAVVDYAKGDGTTATTVRECRDDEVGPDGEPLDKENPCRVKDSFLNAGGQGSLGTPARQDSGDNNNAIDGAAADTGEGQGKDSGSLTSGDSLEHAVALARDGLNPTYYDPTSTRTTFRSFPMSPIEAADLADVSLIDALTGLIVTTRDSAIRMDIDPARFGDLLTLADERIGGDNNALQINSLAFQQELMNNIIPFAGGNIIWTTDGTYYSVATATPSFIEDNGIGLSFSTQARVRAAIVDSDGWISSANPETPQAGALVIDPLSLSTGTINASLWAIDDASGNTSVRALLTTTDDLMIDLSNTSLGVASATRAGDTWIIGRANTFMSFGNDSRLTITLDSPIETILANPDSATNTPLVRINGSIGRLSLSNISLLDGSSKHGIHVGRYTINNLVMANTSIYFENDAIRVDLGKGAENMHMAIERIIIGGTLQDFANRTLPPAIGDAELYITTPDNMQITLRAH